MDKYIPARSSHAHSYSHTRTHTYTHIYTHTYTPIQKHTHTHIRACTRAIVAPRTCTHTLLPTRVCTIPERSEWLTSGNRRDEEISARLTPRRNQVGWVLGGSEITLSVRKIPSNNVYNAVCRMCRCSGKGRSLIEGHVRERILDDARRRRRGSTLFAQVSTQVRRCGGHTTFIESDLETNRWLLTWSLRCNLSRLISDTKSIGVLNLWDVVNLLILLAAIYPILIP